MQKKRKKIELSSALFAFCLELAFFVKAIKSIDIIRVLGHSVYFGCISTNFDGVPLRILNQIFRLSIRKVPKCCRLILAYLRKKRNPRSEL